MAEEEHWVEVSDNQLKSAAKKLLPYCLIGDLETVEKCLSRVKDIKSLLAQKVLHQDKETTTLLHVAAGRGHVQLVRLFLKHGASLGVKVGKSGNTSLHQAVLSRSETLVCLLVDADSSVLDICDDSDRTPLYYAAQAGSSGIVKFLLSVGANKEKKCKKNLSPVHVASYYGNCTSLKILLDHGANPNSIRIERNLTPLLTACRNGHIECVKVLLDNPEIDTACKTTTGWDPLHCAASRGHLAILKLLVGRGISSGLTSPEQWTALHFCCAKSHIETMKYVLDCDNLGHGIDARSESGYTPLHEAAQAGSLEAVKLLVEHGALVDCRSSVNWTPFLMACHANKPDIVELLLKAGANFYQRVGDSQRTCIHIAADKGNIEVLNVLLKCLASKKPISVSPKCIQDQDYINCGNSHGRTPLFLASSHGYSKVAECLLNYGADVDKTEHAGWTPLHAASRRGFIDVVELLLSNGASIDATTTADRFTPLHQACGKGHTEVVKLLLKHSADPDAREVRGWSAVQISVGYGHVATFQALLESNIDISTTTKKGRNVLHILGMHCKDAVYFDFLIAKGLQNLVSQTDRLGNTPLHYVVSGGNFDLVTRFVEHGADVNVANKKGRSALMFGLKYKSVMEKLIESGAEVNHQDSKGMSCLHFAAEHSLNDAVHLLLDSSADPSLLNNINQTPLHLAGSPVIAQCLIQKGIDVDTQDEEGQTPLHISAASRPSVVKVLLDNGISINLVTKKGQSALHYAVQNSPRAALLLIDRGINVEVVDKEGFTALHYSALNLLCGQDIIHAIIRVGANVNALDSSHRTALHHACSVGNMKAIRTLIEEGATIDVTDKDGITPLMLAVEMGGSMCVSALLKNPLDINRQCELYGNSALHVAVGSIEIVRALIEKGADFRLRSKNGDLPLHCAARYGYSDTAEELCQRDKCGELLSLKNRLGESPLVLALKWHQSNVVTLLVNRGALRNVQTDDLVEALSVVRQFDDDKLMDMLSGWFQALEVCEKVFG